MSAAISSVHLCVHDKHRTVQWPNLTPYPDHETSNANVKASYLCFQARMLTSHNWLHIPDYKVHNETKNKSLTFSLAGSSSPLFSNPGGRLPSFAPLLGFVFSGEAALVLQLPQALVQAHLNAAVALDGRQLCPGGLLTLGCSTNMNQEKEGKFASSANQLGCTGELGLSRHTPMPQLLLMADSFAQVNSSPWSAVMNDMNEEENFASSANQFSACNAHHKHAWCGCSCS